MDRVVEGRTSNNLTSVNVNATRAYEGLSNQKMEESLITFGADGMSTFLGAKSGITMKFVNKHAPFMVAIHYMAHRANLVVQTLSVFEVIKHVEDLLATLYIFLLHSSPWWTLEFQKLATCLESEGNKVIRKVKTCWISMLRPTKRVIEEYKPLVTKMEVDAPKEPTTKKNSFMLLEWQNMLARPCLMPILHFLNSLIKFVQSPSYYITYFIFVV
jgi:hypothetical protein